MKEAILQIISAEAEAIRNLPPDDGFENAVELIHEHVHIKNAKLITSGMGKAGHIALNISTSLSATGTPAVFIHPSDAQHGDLGVIKSNDVLLLVSNSGRTSEIVQLIDLVRNLHNGMPTIVITGNPESPLAQQANVVISSGNPSEVCPLGLTPTTSTTVFTVIGDILTVLMMKKIGFTREEYSKRHHGGYLGQKSRNEVE